MIDTIKCKISQTEKEDFIQTIKGNKYEYIAESMKHREINRRNQNMNTYPKILLCVQVKNEGHFLVEFIEFYLLLGVDKIVLYDDNSSDQTNIVKQLYNKKYENSGKKVIFEDKKGRKQLETINSCQKKHDKGIDWLFTVDADLILFSPYFYDFKQMIKSMEDAYPALAHISVYDSRFGVNNVERIDRSRNQLTTRNGEIKLAGNIDEYDYAIKTYNARGPISSIEGYNTKLRLLSLFPECHSTLQVLDYRNVFDSSFLSGNNPCSNEVVKFGFVKRKKMVKMGIHGHPIKSGIYAEVKDSNLFRAYHLYSKSNEIVRMKEKLWYKHIPQIHYNRYNNLIVDTILEDIYFEDLKERVEKLLK